MRKDILITDPEFCEKLANSLKAQYPEFDTSNAKFYESSYVEDEVKTPQSKPVVVTDPDEAYCRIIAKYLNDNYINTGVWNGGPNRPWLNRKDEKAMEEGYKEAVKFVVDRHEAALWLEVKQYFNLAKVNTKQRKPTWNRVKEILKYKTVGKTKRAVRKYLYS